MISFSKRFVHESGPYLRTRASRASITGLGAPDFTTMDVDWGPWTVLAEIASRDDKGPFVGRSSRLNSSSGPQTFGSARPRNAVTVAPSVPSPIGADRDVLEDPCGQPFLRHPR